MRLLKRTALTSVHESGVMALTALPCAVCAKALRNVDDDAKNQPYEGLAFTTHGHYGGTVFDPMNGEFLEINVCDECLVRLGGEGKVLVARDRKPVTHNGLRIGWARVEQDYLPWDRDMPHYDDEVEIDSWDEWDRLRDQFGLTSWFSDGELRELFGEPDEP